MNREHNRSRADRQFACRIVTQLHEAGFVAYFAGGCVRDEILGIEAHDFDVATNATPQQVCKLFGPRKTSQVGAAFGVVCIHEKIEGVNLQVEVATFRVDGDYSDGRRPDCVSYTTAEEDALRRDFTINGLFFDPLRERVIDFVGGVEDIHQKVVRAIGDPHQRFREDKLRLMRAVRFAARFEFGLEHSTEEAVAAMAAEIRVVSPERIAMELRKMFALPNRAWAFQKLFETGLLQAIFPELNADYVKHPDHLVQALTTIAGLSVSKFPLVLAGILLPSLESADLGSAPFTNLKDRWKLANEEIADCTYYCRAIQVWQSAPEGPWSTIQPPLADARSEGAIDLAIASKSLPGSMIQKLKQTLSSDRETWDPGPLLSGDDLRRLGLRPGPSFSKWLTELRRLQLDGILVDRNQAIAWVQGQKSNDA